jgi:hypothetical protein
MHNIEQIKQISRLWAAAVSFVLLTSDMSVVVNSPACRQRQRGSALIVTLAFDNIATLPTGAIAWLKRKAFVTITIRAMQLKECAHEHTLLCIHFRAHTFVHTLLCLHLCAHTFVHTLLCIHFCAYTFVHTLFANTLLHAHFVTNIRLREGRIVRSCIWQRRYTADWCYSMITETENHNIKRKLFVWFQSFHWICIVYFCQEVKNILIALWNLLIESVMTKK